MIALPHGSFLDRRRRLQGDVRERLVNRTARAAAATWCNRGELGGRIRELWPAAASSVTLKPSSMTALATMSQLDQDGQLERGERAGRATADARRVRLIRFEIQKDLESSLERIG